jgi:hypothetical protein
MGWLSAVLGLCLAGCGGAEGDEGRVDVYEVTGTVTMDGKPVSGATVSFSPKDKQPAAVGMTDDSGAYSLTTYESGDGAAAGNYTVLVTKPPEASAGPSGHDAFVSGKPPASHSGASQNAPASSLPVQYAAADTSPFSYTVKEEENTFDIKLEP